MHRVRLTDHAGRAEYRWFGSTTDELSAMNFEINLALEFGIRVNVAWLPITTATLVQA